MNSLKNKEEIQRKNLMHLATKADKILILEKIKRIQFLVTIITKLKPTVKKRLRTINKECTLEIIDRY
jgi:hypothetical protein